MPNFIDAGVQFKKVGVQLKDAGVQLKDAGVQLKDAGVQLKDAGVQLKDAGITERLLAGIPVLSSSLLAYMIGKSFISSIAICRSIECKVKLRLLPLLRATSLPIWQRGRR